MARGSSWAPGWMVSNWGSSTWVCSGCASVWRWSAAASRSSRACRAAPPSICAYRCEAPMTPGPVRILMVDDHPVVLAGLKALVSTDPGLEIVGEARDGRTALRLAMQLVPDVVVMDISLPEMNGVELAAALQSERP